MRRVPILILALSVAFLLSLALPWSSIAELFREDSSLAGAVFVELSGWSELVDLICAGVLYFFFAGAVLGYAYHGWKRDTDNQFRDPVPSAAAVHGYMLALIVGEIGAFSVLLAGFVDAQVL